MSFKNKINLATRVFKSIFLNQMPNYSIIYIDGRCNMLCGFCIHAAMDARKTPIMSAEKWGLIFKKAKSLMHLTVTGGEPFIRKDFVEIIDNVIKSSGVPRVSINSNGFYKERIQNFIPKLIDKHKDTEFTLSISIDGPEEIHDKVRAFKGAYKKALETIEVMNQVEFNSAFMFKYSSRPGTKAAEYDDQVNENIKQDRLEHLIQVQRDMTLKINQKKIGTIQTVIVEKESKKSPHQWAGRTDGNTWVVFDKNDEKIKDMITVMITDAKGVTLFGQRAN